SRNVRSIPGLWIRYGRNFLPGQHRFSDLPVRLRILPGIAHRIVLRFSSWDKSVNQIKKNRQLLRKRAVGFSVSNGNYFINRDGLSSYSGESPAKISTSQTFESGLRTVSFLPHIKAL